MLKQAVFITNRINSSEIRRITNEQGDEVIVAGSFTLPDGVVMNGLLYPAEEIATSYQTLENTLAPVGHPVTSDGVYVSALDPMAIDYFHAGIVNKNVQRVIDDKYGHRVYLEKHINVKVAQQTERGRAVLAAIAKGEPINSSTGLLLEVEESEGVATNGDEYFGIARNITADHDAILLDELGAATPDDGVGLLVNKHLLREVRHSGQTMMVNTVTIQNADIEAQKNTLMQRMKAHIDSFFAGNSETTGGEEAAETTTNEGEDMSMKTLMKERLGDAYNDDMTDEEMLNAYEKSLKGNAADQPGTEGEQGQPSGELEVNADIEKMVAEKVEAAIKANQAAAEKSERDALAEKLKANGVEDIARDEQDKLSVNSLQKLVERTAPKRNSYGVAGGHVQANASESSIADAQMPE